MNVVCVESAAAVDVAVSANLCVFAILCWCRSFGRRSRGRLISLPTCIVHIVIKDLRFVSWRFFWSAYSMCVGGLVGRLSPGLGHRHTPMQRLYIGRLYM